MTSIAEKIKDYFADAGITATLLIGEGRAPDPTQLVVRSERNGVTKKLTINWEDVVDARKLGTALKKARAEMLEQKTPDAQEATGSAPYRIIAVDFDGCICLNRWPEIGAPIPSTILRLREEKERGSKLILWTCRRDEMLKDALEACRDWGIEFDAVNENLPEIIELYGGKDSRKITATEYWDDRAVRVPEYV